MARRKATDCLDHVWPVLGAWAIKQTTICLPVEPSSIEWSISVGDETCFVWAAALQQSVTNRARSSSRVGGHQGWIAARDFIMAQAGIEVVCDAHLQAVEIDIDKKGVTAGLNSRERDWEQFWQCRPLMPAIADCH